MPPSNQDSLHYTKGSFPQEAPMMLYQVLSTLHGRCVQPQPLRSRCPKPSCSAYGQQVDKGKDQRLTRSRDVEKGADNLPWLSHQRCSKVLFTFCPPILHHSVLAQGEANCWVTQSLPQDTFFPSLSTCDYLPIIPCLSPQMPLDPVTVI